MKRLENEFNAGTNKKWEKPFYLDYLIKEIFQKAIEIMYAYSIDKGVSFIKNSWPSKYKLDEGLIKEALSLLEKSKYWMEIQETRKDRSRRNEEKSDPGVGI